MKNLPLYRNICFCTFSKLFRVYQNQSGSIHSRSTFIYSFNLILYAYGGPVFSVCFSFAMSNHFNQLKIIKVFLNFKFAILPATGFFSSKNLKKFGFYQSTLKIISLCSEIVALLYVKLIYKFNLPLGTTISSFQNSYKKTRINSTFITFSLFIYAR